MTLYPLPKSPDLGVLPTEESFSITDLVVAGPKWHCPVPPDFRETCRNYFHGNRIFHSKSFPDPGPPQKTFPRFPIGLAGRVFHGNSLTV